MLRFNSCRVYELIPIAAILHLLLESGFLIVGVNIQSEWTDPLLLSLSLYLPPAPSYELPSAMT